MTNHTKTELKDLYKYYSAMITNSHKRNDMKAYDSYLEKRFQVEIKLNA